MKPTKFGIVQQLKEKHKKRLALAQEELRRRMAKPATRSDSYIPDVLLFWKWAFRVGKGCSGFSLGDVPRVWTDVLDQFLSWLETQCPDFEIHQVKMKLRSLRMYLGRKTEFAIPDVNVRAEISKLEHLLTMPQAPQTPPKARKTKNR